MKTMHKMRERMTNLYKRMRIRIKKIKRQRKSDINVEGSEELKR